MIVTVHRFGQTDAPDSKKLFSDRVRLRLVACVMVHKAASRSKLLDDATFAKWKCKPFRLAHCTRKECSLSTNGRK